MAEPSQFSFELKEVAALLIKQQGLHEGVWALGFEFGLGVGAIGPNPTEARPSAFVQVNKVMLSKPPEAEAAHSAFVVDAAVVNPRPKSAKQRK